MMNTLSRRGAQCVDRNAKSHISYGIHCLRDIKAKVGLAKKNHGLSAAFPNRCEISFDSSRVQISIERCHQEYRVDIGRDNLLYRLLSSGLPGKLGLAWKH